MHANHNMIGQLAIYSRGSTPNIVIEPRKERFSQKNSNQHVTFINYFGGDIQ
jgi:hypothetical protein